MRTTGDVVAHRPAATLASRGGRPGSGITLTFTFSRTVAKEEDQSKGLKQSHVLSGIISTAVHQKIRVGKFIPNLEYHQSLIAVR